MSRTPPLVCTLVLAAAGVAPAQVGVSNLATGVSQNFDTLSSAVSGTSNTFTGNVTLPGFYSNQSNYITSAGGSETAGLRSFGAAGNSDRALGAFTTGTVPAVQFMLTVRNDSGQPIGAATVGFDGEQWRAASPNTLRFSYQTSATNLTSTTAGTFTDVTALDFASTNNPTGGTATGVFPPEVTAKSATITFPTAINPGEYVAFRWSMTDVAGSDPGLGIDNLAITFATPVPEPMTGLGLAAAAFGLVRLARRGYHGGGAAQGAGEGFYPFR